MYFKVALLITTALLFSACSANKAPKPAVPVETNATVKVVEEVTEVVTPNKEATIMPLEEDTVKEKTLKDEHGFKPEPFSVKNNEEDPELLGPQSTISKPIGRKKDEQESETSTKDKES